MTRYILDTNVFMEPFKRDYYAFDTHPAFWDFLDNLFNTSDAISTSAVYGEIVEKDDELSKWVKVRKVHFPDLDERSISGLKAVADKATEWQKTAKTSQNAVTDFLEAADSNLVAVAKVCRFTLVTYETHRNSQLKKIKIPDFCLDMGVVCISLPELFRQTGVTFSGFTIP